VTDEISIEKSAPRDRDVYGPFDETEVGAVRPWVDLGSIKLVPQDGIAIRLEVEEGTGRAIAVAIDYNGSTLQVQPFASTRSTGMWHEIRAQIAEQLRVQGAEVNEVSGELGPELHALVPAALPNGAVGQQPARFVGVDGPRWFLRGVIAGPAAVNQEDGRKLLEVFRGLVVVRGQQPMPPRDLLPLRVPVQ